MNKYKIISIAGCSLLLSVAAFADPLSSEQGLRKAIHENIERTHAATAKKYDRVLSLAGDRRRELAVKKDAVAKSYSEWHRLNAAVNDSKNPDAAQFKVLEAAAQNYARTSRAFMELQTEILAKKNYEPENIVSVEAINVLNAAAPAAAGKKHSKAAERKSPKRAKAQ
ncbi:MAG: hypothetical protein HYZ46_08395 [Nitrosomonadales bacterium]|nr:hypothetical protein [Nitrosomonadales bacterium]